MRKLNLLQAIASYTGATSRQLAESRARLNQPTNQPTNQIPGSVPDEGGAGQCAEG